MEAILTALVTGCCSVIGIVITVRASGKKQRIERREDLEAQQEDIKRNLERQQAEIKAELDKHEAVSNQKIDALSERVEKHNGVIERTYKLETDVANLFHRFSECKAVADEGKEKAAHACERADAAHNRLDRAGIQGGTS